MEVIFQISLIVVKDPEKLGLIRRIKDSNDKRLTIISLTSVGKHKIEVILPQHYKKRGFRMSDIKAWQFSHIQIIHSHTYDLL